MQAATGKIIHLVNVRPTRKNSSQLRSNRQASLFHLCFVSDAAVQPSANAAKSRLTIGGALVHRVTYPVKQGLEMNGCDLKAFRVQFEWERDGIFHLSLYYRPVCSLSLESKTRRSQSSV
jgi:hypothetical protein